jgi:hypothetical protein
MYVKKFLSKQSYSEGYEEKKIHLMNNYMDVDETKFEEITCSYGVKFQINLLEEAIEYIINLLLYNKKNVKYHLFYYKLWNYYNKIGYIISAHNANNYCDAYKPYILKSAKQIVNLTNIKVFESSTAKLKALPKTKKHNIVNSTDLPIGHFLDETAKLYDIKKGWFIAYDYNYSGNKNVIENDIVIGFYDKSETGIDLKFKLRPPVHRVKTKDLARKEEKGKVCDFNVREDLVEIANKLGLDIDDETIKSDICYAIKNKLIQNENKELCKCISNRIKWFYRHFEVQPI